VSNTRSIFATFLPIMSSVYASEPATSGRVVFETTHGPLDVQLWCRECPTTTKLFLQLCLDGFYDGVLFHRIAPKFLIQAGAMRKRPDRSDIEPAVGQQKSAMEEYRHKVSAENALERRKYEIHSRLRFNHRGQLAMAHGVDDDPDIDVQPQFFITLEEASFLDGKHVLFGTVSAGPTVFNALRIGGVDVDEETNQPSDLEHAPRITGVRIVDNPLHQDIKPQTTVPWKQQRADEIDGTQQQKKKKKRKGKRDLNVLSFGEEMAEEVEADGSRRLGMKSSHDVVQSRGLAKDVDREVQGSVETADEVKPQRKGSSKTLGGPSKGMENTERDHMPREATVRSNEASVPNRSEPQRNRTTDTETEPDSVASKEKAPVPSASSSVSFVEMRKAKYVKGQKDKRKREADTMSKLFAFQSKVKGQVAAVKAQGSSRSRETNDNSLASRMARRAQEGDDVEGRPDGDDSNTGYHGQVLENDGDDTDRRGGGGGGDWLQTRFKCRRHIDHGTRDGSSAVGGDGRNMDDYEVVDEREEKNKGGSRDNRERPRKHHKTHHHRDRDAKGGGHHRREINC